MTNTDALIEQLAAIEHERWADWQKYMHSKGGLVGEVGTYSTGDLILPSVLVEQWERQIATPYAELSEKEKDSDREQVDRYWPLIEALTVERDALQKEVVIVLAGEVTLTRLIESLRAEIATLKAAVEGL